MTHRYNLHTPLPASIKPPLRMREPGANFEGEVAHPLQAVRWFEPMDVLNHAIELVDQNGKIILIKTDHPEIIEANEYPKNFEDIYYVII